MANSKATAAPIKVVLIEYHHIQTDVSNFKSVVQSLTGKRSSAVDGFPQSRKRQRVLDQDQSCGGTTPSLHSASFKDLDILLKLNLPSMEEDLTWIWADN